MKKVSNIKKMSETAVNNRKQLFELICQSQKVNHNYAPDEIMTLVLEAQQAVRAKVRNST